MARKKLDSDEAADLFANNNKAAPQRPQDPEKDPVSSYGVGLRVSEWQRVADIGGELGISKHAVAAYALRYFLKQYEAGEIQPVQKPALPGL